MIDTSAMRFPKPNVGKARREKQRGKLHDGRGFRQSVFALDGHKCMDKTCECHKQVQPELNPHHINFKGRGVVDNSVGNGITLCQYGAHRRVHDGYKKDGTFVTADQAMLEILEQHRESVMWRWDEQYERLKLKT